MANEISLTNIYGKRQRVTVPRTESCLGIKFADYFLNKIRMRNRRYFFNAPVDSRPLIRELEKKYSEVTDLTKSDNKTEVSFITGFVL